MPTSLEIKRLNNIKHAKLDLENKMAELDPNSEEYANLLIKLNIAIVNFTKKLNICISKKLLTDENIPTGNKINLNDYFDILKTCYYCSCGLKEDILTLNKLIII